ncbi:MAG: hypothetical protein HYX35_06625 [Proteobacteria bacterium]|nr:hypothetical protein [Pseudomonadota bacterium]
MIGEIAKWLLIVIGGLVGFTILYIIGWQIAASVAPDAVEKYNLHFVIKDIRKYFGFLFGKGYTISNTHYSYEHFGNWIVTLESQKCKIHLVQDRLELLVSFSPGKADTKVEFGLGAMIYFVTKGHKMIGFFEGNHSWGKKKQFERMANLLKEYHDQIVPYLDNENPWESAFGKHKDELMSVQKKYNDVLMADYRQKHTRK